MRISSVLGGLSFGRSPSRARRPRFRPRVKPLEERCVPSFTPVPAGAVGTNPWTVVAADFNRDGNPDFAVTNSGSKSVSFRLGNGQGGFVPVPDLTNPSWSGPVPLAVGQFTNDDIPDLVLGYHQVDSGTDSGETDRFKGDGQGGFDIKGGVGVVGADPRSLAVADFDGDGRSDYAVAYAGTNSFRITTVTSDFSSNTRSPISTGTAVPQFVAAGDFDRDGKQDLAVADYSGYAVTLLVNTFPDPPPPAPAPRSLVASLVSVKQGRKRRLRVVVRYADTGEIKAEFSSPFNKPAYRGIAALALDTNGDGTPDAVQVTAVKAGPRKKTVRSVIPL